MNSTGDDLMISPYQRRPAFTHLCQRILLLLVLATAGSGCVFSQFIYVLNAGNDVSGYSLDEKTGALTAVAGSPFAAGLAPAGVAVDPSGRFVYVANRGSNTVSAYTVDANNGALKAVDGALSAAGEAPSSVTIHPAGKFVYVTNSGSGDVSGF